MSGAESRGRAGLVVLGEGWYLETTPFWIGLILEIIVNLIASFTAEENTGSAHL